jgi:outer membrane protein assembly factor BamB
MDTKPGRLPSSDLFAFAGTFVLAVLVAGCGGAGSGRSLPVTDAPVDSSGTRAALSVVPAATSSPAFNTWPTYGYDNAHDGYNPNSALFTSAGIATLHLGWQLNLGETGTQTQPILATNVGSLKGVLFVSGRKGLAYGVNAATGKSVWSRSFGTEQMKCVGVPTPETLGMQSTAVYDPVAKVVYEVASTNAAPNAPAAITIYKLAPATGATLGSVNVTPSNLPGEIDFAHTGLTLAGGTLYVGTGSTCDLSAWRGAVYAVNVGSMTLENAFYTVYGQGGAYSGGGVWGWGGAAVDASGNVYIGVGNADYNTGKNGPQPPFVTTTNEEAGYGDHMVSLSSNLSTVLSSYAVPYQFSKTERNLDLSGTPVLFTPTGCPTMVAIQGKSGLLNFYTAANIGAGPIASFTFSVAADDVSYIGNGSYSPVTGLYYANVPTSSGGSIRPPGMVAFSMSGCTPSIVWSSQFGADSYQIGAHDGQPRSAPTVTAGNVVFVASPTTTGKSQLWALDATTGTVLNGGAPVFTTANLLRMPPVVDGKWIYLLDQGGHLYGLSLDLSVPAIAATLQQTEVHTPAW